MDKQEQGTGIIADYKNYYENKTPGPYAQRTTFVTSIYLWIRIRSTFCSSCSKKKKIFFFHIFFSYSIRYVITIILIDCNNRLF